MFNAKPLRLAAVAALALLLGSAGVTVAAAEPEVEIEVFTRPGCPRCREAEAFLHELERERPGLRLRWRDVEGDAGALERLTALAQRQGVQVIGVPAFLVRDVLLIGFGGEEHTGAQLRALLAGDEVAPQSAGACASGDADGCAAGAGVEVLRLPLLGALDRKAMGLPLFTIAIGLLDGFNPCAMWVLLFLLSLLVNVHDRVKMFLIGGTFVLASGVVYFAFMAAWLNLFLLIGFSSATRIALGVVATAIGAINVKDSLALGRGISLSIPAGAKPHLYARVRSILQAEQLPAAIAGAAVLAVLANTVELLCTAGFPAVYTQVLTLEPLPRWGYYAYLALYNLAYVFDDALMVLVAVITLSRTKLQERAGRWLKLISGTVMLALGIALLLKPEWLVFGAP